MELMTENKEQAIRYLYGEHLEAERDDIEERLFTDEDFSLFVDDVENDLIDEYLRGELSFEEKRRFETKYLTTDGRRDRVALAGTLHEKVFAGATATTETLAAETPPAGFGEKIAAFFRFQNLALAGGFAAVLFLLVLGGVWLSTQPGDDIVKEKDTNENENIAPPPDDPMPVPTPEENTNSASSEENKNTTESVPPPKPADANVKSKPVAPPPKAAPKKPVRPKPAPPVRQQPRIFIATLLPPLRSSKTPVLEIPAGAETVRLQLVDNFGAKYEKFLVELNDGIGNTVWSGEVKAGRAKPQKSVTVSIPNTAFGAGNYEVAVSGVTSDGSTDEINFYNFTVRKNE
jgi:hypothetical protein